MDRKIMQNLVKWKNKAKRKPLIMQGARQVGKTWILKHLGEKHFKRIAYINFDNNPEWKRCLRRLQHSAVAGCFQDRDRYQDRR